MQHYFAAQGGVGGGYTLALMRSSEHGRHIVSGMYSVNSEVICEGESMAMCITLDL